MAYPYNNFNPYNAPQAGFSFGGPGYPPAPQTTVQAAQTPQAGSLVRLVTSKEEAVASQIPFDGSTTYFSDTSNGKIYAKTFDFNTGTAPIVTYVREQAVTVQYATVDDLNALRAEIDALRKPGKAAKKNDAADE